MPSCFTSLNLTIHIFKSLAGNDQSHVTYPEKSRTIPGLETGQYGHFYESKQKMYQNLGFVNKPSTVKILVSRMVKLGPSNGGAREAERVERSSNCGKGERAQVRSKMEGLTAIYRVAEGEQQRDTWIRRE
ncbi:hypothetical protein L2E82_45751 [Cichorium intybus]|uniref:Uncharacterized protein n=1 Tax=Cichorium intybus TaxID=13427 RepID=A0ACB8ZSW8_CICIN|nr:hypothetical protein L2E82_45751 [Cichorium intybus]